MKKEIIRPTPNNIKASPIVWVSVGYMFGYCPICGHGNQYRDALTISYCHYCGQMLKWVQMKKVNHQRNLKTYLITFRTRALKNLETKKIKAINMLSAINHMYLFSPNRFDVIEVKEIEY